MEIDLGIKETLEALHAPAIQEKILPYLEGFDLVGKKKEHILEEKYSKK